MLGRTTIAVFLAALALHADVGAQTPQERTTAQPAGAAGVPGDRSGAAVRVETGPAIDGSLDEATWSTAQPLGGFVQYEPVAGAPPSENTEARFLFDGEAIYIGVWMYDGQPDQIIAGERRRDAGLGESDGVVVVLDTYLDQQTGFVFGTNPGAIEYDGQVRGEGGANTSWDGSWTVATSQDGQGWYAEMRIPFSTLRLGTGDEQTWGLNVMRYIGRKNEQVVWSPVPRQYGFFRLTEAGQLSGIAPPPRRVMTLTPYVLTAASRVPRIDPDVDYPFEWGADGKVGITQGLALDLTYNTDFAQVEADDQQVDLTRFNLFFPEKRPFFLENSDLFRVGLDQLPGRTSGRTALFHSRRIGVASGQQVPIEAGGRLSGRAAGIDIGALHMRTEGLSTPGTSGPVVVQEPTGWSVARVAKELPNRSRVGAIFTDRSSNTSSDFGRTYGADARIGIGERWTFNAVAGFTEEPGVSGSNELLSAVGEYLTPTWYFRAYHDRVGDNFDPQLGFIPNPSGFTESSGRIERIWRPQNSRLREARAHIRRTWAHDRSGFKELEFRHLHLNFNLQDGSQFSPAFQWMEEGLRVPFVISGAGITVPAGSYKGWNSYGNFRTSTSAPISFNGRWDMGMYLSGNRWGGSLGMAFRRSDVLTGSVSVAHNRIRLPEGAYNTTLTRVGVQYAFSPSIFLQSVVQYSDQSGTWTANARFGWLGTAGTGLYVVYNERQDLEDVRGVGGLFPHGSIEPAERTLAIKFTQQIDLAELGGF